MITLVINAGGWTFNKDAVTDVWFGEQRNATISVYDTLSESGSPQADNLPQRSCNHWCHAVGHFAGLLNRPIQVMFDFENEFSAPPPFNIEASSLDGQFRPPRLLS